MKKFVRYFLYLVVVIIFLLQVGINIFLKDILLEVVSKNFPNIELKYTKIYYVIPNIIFFRDLSVVNKNFELKIIKGAIFFNPLRFVFKNTSYILFFNFNNIFVKLYTYNSKDLPNIGFEEIIDEAYVKKEINLLPFKFKIKNGILLNNENVLIKNFNIDFVRTQEKSTAKIYFDSYGYSVIMKLFGNNKMSRWNIDFEINPVVKMLTTYTPEIKGKLFGFYNFKKQQQFNFSVISGGKKTILKGTFSLYPFLLKGKIFGDIVKGEYNIRNLDNVFNTNFEGKIMLKKIMNLEKETDLQTTLKYEKTVSDYKYDFMIYSNNFMLESIIENGAGNLKFKQKNVIIDAKINYDNKNKVLNVYSKDKSYPIDIKLFYNNEMLTKIFKFDGNFINYKTNGIIKNVGSEFDVRIKFDSRKNYSDIYFLTNFSTGMVKIIDKDKIYKGELKLFSDINYSEKKINFDLNLNNYRLFNTKVSGLLVGNLYDENILSQNSQRGNIEIKKLILDNREVFDEIKFDFKTNKQKNVIKIFLEDTNKKINVNGSYNIDTKYYNILTKVGIDNILYKKLKFNLASELRISGKLDNIDITGSYNIDSIYYDNKKFGNSFSGKATFKNNRLTFYGNYFFDNNKIDYKSTYNIKNKTIDLFLKNIKYDDKKYNVELYLKTNDFDQKNIFLTGKIYDQDGVVEILPKSSIILEKPTIILKTKFKNINFKNISLIGNIDFFIEKKYVEKIACDITITNFWINQFNFNRSVLNVLFDTKNKVLTFLETQNVKQLKTISVMGKIIFLPKSTFFDNFIVEIFGDRHIVLDGKIGDNKNLLKLRIKDLPIELFKNVLGFTQIQVAGDIVSDTTIKTVLGKDYKTNKLKYLIKSNFELKEASFYGFRLKNIVGKISTLGYKLFLDELNLNFGNNQKIVAKGKIDLEDEKININLISKNSSLSIFNGFADLVKSADGKFFLNINVDGNIKSPKMNGYMEVINGQTSFNKYLKNLENINIRIEFVGNKVIVQQFVAKHKNTTLRLVGSAKVPEEYNFKLFTETEKGLPINIPELSFPVGQFFKFAKTEKFFASYGEPRIDFTLTKKKNSIPKLSGEIILDETHFTYPPKEHINTHPGGKMYYEIKINSGKNTWYENELISANISGSIVVKNLASTKGEVVDGEIFSTQGNINYLGINFKLKNARLQVINSIVYLELLGETVVVENTGRKNTIQLIVDRDRIENIKPRLVSIDNPQLKSEDIVSILLGLKKFDSQDFYGREQIIPKDAGVDTTAYLRQQIIRLIDSNFATPLARNILQKTGLVDDVSVSYAPSEEKNVTESVSPMVYLKDTKYSFGKYLSDDILMGYSIILGEEQQKLQLRHEIEIAYRLKGNLFLRGAYNFGQRSSEGKVHGSETRIGIEPVWRFGGEKWDE